LSIRPVIKVIRKNVPGHLNRDIYHNLLTISWPKTIALFTLVFLLINITFATLYWLDSSGLKNSDGEWVKCFYFSVQTLGTIGYGQIFPVSNFVNLLVTVQAGLGAVFFAILAGFFFAKFSRPFAKIEFTKNLVITEFDGRPTVMFRMINIRNNQILDSSVHATMLKGIITKEGMPFRKFIDLKLLRSKVPLFSMSMNMMHIIDEESPFWGMKAGESFDSGTEILISALGVDGTFGQMIHSSHLYTTKDLIWNKRFKDIVTVLGDGVRIIDYADFNELVDG